MKKFVALALFFLFLFSSAASALQYPYIGMSKGDGVRLRADPGKKGNIIGKVNKGDVFVVMGEIFVDGQKWLEIDHPTKKGTAFISAQFVKPEYEGNENIDTAGCKMSAEIQMAFGITQDKALAIHGRPKDFADGPGTSVLIYKGFQVEFLDDRLQRVEVKSGLMPFGDICLGDSQEKLLRVLGNEIEDPDENFEGWTCRNALGEEIFFEFRTDKNGETVINFMTWESPVG